MANRIWNEHFCFINWQSLWGGLKTWMDYSAVRTRRKESSSSLWTLMCFHDQMGKLLPQSAGSVFHRCSKFSFSIRSVISCMPHKAFVRGSFALVLGLLLLNTIASCSWLITDDVKPKATRRQTRPYIYGTGMFKRSHPVKMIRCKPRYSPLKANPEHRANLYQLYVITQ